MAGEALSRMGQCISSFKLIPGGHGKFDIRIDGELVGEHRHEPDAHIFRLAGPVKAMNQRDRREGFGLSVPRQESRQRAVSIRVATRLSRGWLLLPHFGDCMQLGQPSLHGHSDMARKVVLHSSSII